MSLIMLTTSPLLISPVTSSWSMSPSFFDIRLSKFLKKSYIKNIIIMIENYLHHFNNFLITTVSLQQPFILFFPRHFQVDEDKVRAKYFPTITLSL